ncbi:MAG TPA: VTT domain-containing protein [Polyangiaceae bacterium]
MGPSELSRHLQHASLGMILGGLLLSELGLPLPETVFVVAAGVVTEQSGMGMGFAIVATCTTVILGDLLLYLLARRYGPAASKHVPLSFILTERVVTRIDELFQRHGAMAIFTSRFITGLRGAAFALAGMRRLPLLRFLLWDGLAVLLTVPVFAVIGYVFSTSMDALAAKVELANRWLLGMLVGSVAGYVGVTLIRRRRRDGT